MAKKNLKVENCKMWPTGIAN